MFLGAFPRVQETKGVYVFKCGLIKSISGNINNLLRGETLAVGQTFRIVVFR